MGNIHKRRDGVVYLSMVQVDIPKLRSFLEEVVVSSRILNLVYEADQYCGSVFVNFSGKTIRVRKSNGRFFIDLKLPIHDKEKGIFDRGYKEVLTGEGESIDDAMKDVISLLRDNA